MYLPSGSVNDASHFFFLIESSDQEASLSPRPERKRAGAKKGRARTGSKSKAQVPAGVGEGVPVRDEQRPAPAAAAAAADTGMRSSDTGSEGRRSQPPEAKGLSGAAVGPAQQSLIQMVAKKRRRPNFKLPPGLDPSDSQLDKETRRILKNRASAQRSRDKKQEYVDELEARLKIANAENARLNFNLAQATRKEAMAEAWAKALARSLPRSQQGRPQDDREQEDEDENRATAARILQRSQTF